jgi:outer membrane murein-binding lipoprotein Lpp
MNPAERQLESMPEERQAGNRKEPIAPALPEIPSSDDLFTSVIGALDPEEKSEKIQKRASNVMKLAQENKNLEAELKALTDRLEAAEKRAEKREGRPYGAS